MVGYTDAAILPLQKDARVMGPRAGVEVLKTEKFLRLCVSGRISIYAKYFTRLRVYAVVSENQKCTVSPTEGRKRPEAMGSEASSGGWVYD